MESMKYPYEEFREETKVRIVEAIKKLYGIEVEIKIERPKEIADLAFPCFSLSKVLKKKPGEIAKEIAKEIKKEGWIEKVEAINGYVNFFI
ncbi:MAG: arginine--tRNA ligase, partial [Thermoplasmata archaeon]